MTALAPYLKALVAFLAPGLLIVGDTLVTGSMPAGDVWLKALGAAVVTGLAVYRVPNVDRDGTHADESTKPPGDVPAGPSTTGGRP